MQPISFPLAHTQTQQPYGISADTPQVRFVDLLPIAAKTLQAFENGVCDNTIPVERFQMECATALKIYEWFFKIHYFPFEKWERSYCYYGLCLETLGQPDRAAAAYMAASQIEEDPDRKARLIKHTGMVFKSMRRFPEAIAYLRKAADIEGVTKETKEQCLTAITGICWYQLGVSQRSNKTVIELCLTLGEACLQLDKFEDALNALKYGLSQCAYDRRQSFLFNKKLVEVSHCILKSPKLRWEDKVAYTHSLRLALLDSKQDDVAKAVFTSAQKHNSST